MQRSLYAVLGDPIDHSLSPAMQQAAFDAAHLPARYERLRVTARELGQIVLDLRRRGHAGFNITIPHKESVGVFLDELSPDAGAIGAVNTVVRQGDRLIGHNTDAPGFLAALRAVWLPSQEAPVVVLGTGGAARAVVSALLTLDLSVTVVTRSPTQPFFAGSPDRGKVMLLGRDTPEAVVAVQRAGLVVNATPLGMPPLENACPLPHGAHLDPQTAVVDLVYGRRTPLLQLATSAGCRSSDGLEMLVQQGAAAFRLWTGIDPDVEIMRRACADALRKGQICSVS